MISGSEEFLVAYEGGESCAEELNHWKEPRGVAGVAQVLEGLSSKFEALSSNPKCH
jgi:hypothetical protein